MHLTPFQKRSPFATPTPKQIVKQSYYNSNVKSLQRSLHLHSNGQRNHDSHKRSQERQIKEETASVIKELSMSFLYAMCQNFQQIINREMNEMVTKILALELKIAECQKKFNAIEIQLHKKSKEISTLIEQNCVLIELNRDIEVRMEQLRQKYQVSYATVKNQWMTNLIEEFRDQIAQIESVSQQCESCQKGVKEIIKKELNKLQTLCGKEPPKHRQGAKGSGALPKDQDRIQALKNGLKLVLEVIYDSLPRPEDGCDRKGWKWILLQNIDLKFEILSLRQQLKNSPLAISLTNL